MGVSYKQVNEKIVISDHPGSACYFSVFDYGVKTGATKLLCHEPTIAFNINLNLIEYYIEQLNEWGFPCKYLAEDAPEYEKYSIEKGRHIFEIDLSFYNHKNHLCSTLTLLRYMYEGSFHEYITNFFEITAKYPDLDKFKVFQLSFRTFIGNGHTCHYKKNLKFITLQELFDKFPSNGGIFDAKCSNIFSCWDQKEASLKNISLQNVIHSYKALDGDDILNVYVVGGSKNYANWLPNFKVTDDFDSSDLVLFTGGEDVDPSMYGEPMGARTGSNLQRDLYEKEFYDKALLQSKKMLGICRGSQFLCVMNGGKLVQHQENPKAVHEINVLYKEDYYEDPFKINITSTHHQAAYPYSIPTYKYRIIGWTNGISSVHLDGNENELNPAKECEIVYYSYTNCLGIQGHPEFSDYQKNYPKDLKKVQELFNRFINNKL